MRPTLSPLRLLRSLALLVCLTVFDGAGLAAQPASGNACERAVAALQKEITESYDNIEALDAILQEWVSGLQQGMSVFSPSALREMSEADIEKARDSLNTLKECMPKIQEAFDRLKKRMGELEDMLDTNLSGDRLHMRRMEKIQEVDELHAEVANLLRSMIG